MQKFILYLGLLSVDFWSRQQDNLNVVVGAVREKALLSSQHPQIVKILLLKIDRKKTDLGLEVQTRTPLRKTQSRPFDFIFLPAFKLSISSLSKGSRSFSQIFALP